MVVLYTRPYRLTARTEPSQGLNRGSIPRRVTELEMAVYTVYMDKKYRTYAQYLAGFLLVLGVWQLLARGVAFENSSALLFLAMAALVFGLSKVNLKK